MRITDICFDSLDKEANLFFYGFDRNVQLKKVHEFFTKWGNVITVAFSYDES